MSSVGPDLGVNCLQKLSADNTSRQRTNTYLPFVSGSVTFTDTPVLPCIFLFVNKLTETASALIFSAK